MDLILAILSVAGALIGAVVVKVTADDVKEWTPRVTRRLLDIAVRRLPEGRRERYVEEWAAHLAEVPGVIGKLAVSLQFQIAAFKARELYAKARLDAWRNEQATVLAGIQAMAGEVLTSVGRQPPIDEDRLEEGTKVMQGALIEVIRQLDELDARRPALGITVAGATLMIQDIFSTVRRKVRTAVTRARNKLTSLRGGTGVLRMSEQFDK